MNREIKFRVWNKRLKRFVSKIDIGEIKNSNGNNCLVGVTFASDEEDTNSQKFEDCIIQQFTGLKSKNGVDIYEGDLIYYELDYKNNVKYKNIALVEWKNYCFYLSGILCQAQNQDDKKFDRWIKIGDHIANASFEVVLRHEAYNVIGNIFENPELIPNE